jgi:hypothetical protein
MTTNVSRKKARRPAKPYPEYPLTPNPNGQWSKKVRGKVRYFGVWANPDAAEAPWNEQKEDLLAGRKSRSRDGLTVGDLFHRFLDVKVGLVEDVQAMPMRVAEWAKTITPRHWKHCVRDLVRDEVREIQPDITNAVRETFKVEPH